MKASYSMAQAAALLGDPSQTWATNDYLKAYMQLAQDRIVEDVLKIPDLGALTDTVIISDVPIQTYDLSAYSAEGSGGVLEQLSEVISIKERATSVRDELHWQMLLPARDIPTFQTGPFNGYYSVNGSLIRLPGANQLIDLRIFAKFTPAVIVNGDSVIQQGIAPAVSLKTAAYVARSRGNRELANDYMAEAEAAQESYLCNMIMEMQAVRLRMRSYSGNPLQIL